MKPYESITEMTNRLNALLTTLRKLGKHYSKEDVNTKILRVLPKNDWESRVTSIEESHDLSKLSTDILIGKLLTHELILRQREEEQQSKNKKSLALKASHPKLKHRESKERRRAFKAAWNDSSESEMEEDERVNLCFMAFEDDNEIPSSSNSSFYEFNDNCHDNINDDDDDYDDDISMVRNLMSKCKSLLSKKNHYKDKLISLTKELENLKNEHSSLTISHDKLVNDLKNSNSLEEQLKKVNDENHKLSNEML